MNPRDSSIGIIGLGDMGGGIAANLVGAGFNVMGFDLKPEEVQLRGASAGAGKQAKRHQQIHQVGDIMRMVNGFIFLTCVCGLKLKVPPNFKAPTVKCPRCSRTLDVAAQKKAQADRR